MNRAIDWAATHSARGPGGIPLLCVVGPTASGKSDFAVALARAVGGEIVSADSVQIYRRFDIGSAKLSASERSLVPHHLIDALDPLDPCDAARFSSLADKIITDLATAEKPVVICGGTFLWVRALLYGLAPTPPADAHLREQLQREAERLGRAHLHERLREIDPVLHARLSPNDFVRVSRALEVHALTGKPLSELQAAHGFREQRYPAQLLALEHERHVLHDRVRIRTERMLTDGLVAEVRELLRDGLDLAPALRSVGYRQVVEHLTDTPNAEDSPLALSRLGERIRHATNQLVRHQMTWLRGQQVQWLSPQALPGYLETLAMARSSL